MCSAPFAMPHARPCRSLLRPLLVAIFVTTAYGCGDHDPTSSASRMPALPLRRLEPGYTQSVQLPDASGTELPAVSATLMTLAEARLISVTVSQSMTATYLGSGTTPNRAWGINGYQCTYGDIAVSTPGKILSGTSGGCNTTVTTRTGNPILASGVVTASRDVGFARACGDTDPCWSYSGTSSASAVIVQVPAWLHAAATSSSTAAMVTHKEAPGNHYFEVKLPSTMSSAPWVADPNMAWKFRADADSVWRKVNCSTSGKGCWYYVPSTGTMIARYRINGEWQDLAARITVGRATLTLSASQTAIYPGDTVTFTATATPQGVSVSNVVWRWIVGTDSLPVCANAGLTCTYVPSGAGTMQVSAHVGSLPRTANADIALKSNLNVSCTPVVRGEETTCSATASPSGGPINISEWSFVSTGSGPSYATTQQRSEPTWVGIAALSGTVTVRATLAGVAQQASANLSVSPRATVDTIAYTITENSPGLLPEVPASDSGDFGVVGFVPGVTTRGLSYIGSGPNEGLSFFRSLPFHVAVEVSINVVAMQSGSAFWYMQSPTRRDGAPGGRRYCSRSDVVASEPLVREHEGMTRNATNSHTKVYLDAFQRDMNVIIEPYVSDSPNVFPFIQDVHNAATAEAYTVTHAPGVNPFDWPCVFNYNPGLVYP